MNTYVIKMSIRENSEAYEECKKMLSGIISKSKLVPLGDDEYGTDEYSVGMGMISFLGKQDWFLDNAKELLFYDGEDFDDTHKYREEDSLKYYLDKRNRGGDK